jgi:signal recognition particle receptor subunit beta
MVQFNFSERTIKAKVVYYGPAQSGKTTNLEQIHRATDPTGKNRLISLNTAQDRTLFFDLLPVSLGTVSGYDFKLQLYTVPGQVQYNATRRVVLAGADAVVFVADARRSALKENVSAFENMKVNLLANRLVPEKIPLVLQYNKQDLPDLMSAAELNKALNPWQRPSFAAAATKPEGVMETFIAIVGETLTAIATKYGLKEKGLDPAQVPRLVAAAFETRLKEETSAAARPEAAARAEAPSRIVMSQAPETAAISAAPAAGEGGLVAEDLLHRAIRSNVELAESLGDLIREINEGLARILAQSDFLIAYRDALPDKRASAAKAVQDEALRLRAIVQGLGQRVAEAKPRDAGPAAPPPTPAVAPRAAPPPAAKGVELLLRSATAAAQPLLQPRGVTVDLRVTPGTPVPRGPAAEVERVVVSLLSGLARVAAPGGAVVRCEKKPVLLKSSTGDVRREFVMIAIANNGGPGEADQQRVLQGGDSGPLGEAYRLIRGLGGFLRFAPLTGGGVETRVFLPEGSPQP